LLHSLFKQYYNINTFNQGRHIECINPNTFQLSSDLVLSQIPQQLNKIEYQYLQQREFVYLYHYNNEYLKWNHKHTHTLTTNSTHTTTTDFYTKFNVKGILNLKDDYIIQDPFHQQYNKEFIDNTIPIMGFILSYNQDETFPYYLLLGWNVYGQKCLFRYSRYSGFEILIKFKNKNSIIDISYNWNKYIGYRVYGIDIALYFNQNVQNCYQMETVETYPLTNYEEKSQYYMIDVERESANKKNISVENYNLYNGTSSIVMNDYKIFGIYVSPYVIFQNYKLQYDMNGYV
jgi:hypothetical protein